jgi:hypothetical protein
MGILDKAKEIGDKVSESITNFSSDEVIASTVIRAVEKQEKVNALLQEKGSNYRVSDIDLGMGIPPTVTFGVRRINENTENNSTGLVENTEE